MTAISSTSTAANFASRFENRLQNRVQNAVSSGQISSADGTAISKALSDVQSQLSAGASPQSSATSSQAPTSFQDKIGSLIDNEVSSGKLTSAQATELKTVLSQGIGRGHHGHRAGGSDPDNDGDGNNPASLGAASTDPSSQTATTAQSVNPVDAFLKILQDSQNTNNASYSASGSNAQNNSTTPPLLLNTLV